MENGEWRMENREWLMVESPLGGLVGVAGGFNPRLAFIHREKIFR
jgi:hypothetical protein